MKFDDETCYQIFGKEDAENETEERFTQYFFVNKAYENLNSSLPIRILVGQKGVGKSAVLKRCHIADKEKNKVSIWLQPQSLKVPKYENNLVEHIERWKVLLLNAVAEKVVETLTSDALEKPLGERKNVKAWLGLLANKVREKADVHAEGASTLLVKRFLSETEVKVYIDDIDRGWDASAESIRNIAALLNAIRDLSGDDERLKFRIALRSDVYFLVRTSDESTDKIETNVIKLEWDNHDILCVVAMRVSTYFQLNFTQSKLRQMRQKDITAKILSRIIVEKFEGKGRWSNRPVYHVLLSLTRRRPRDLIKLMHGAARNAYQNDNSIISTGDLEGCFDEYSYERLQDIANEYKSEVPEIRNLVLGMRPTTKQRKAKENYLFTTDELVSKIKTIQRGINVSFRNGTLATPKAILQFLYKIEFITARRVQDDGNIDRKFFDQSRFLADELNDFGYNWEIHPAYRWALQPQDINSIFETLD